MSQRLRDLAYGNLVQVAESIETGRLVPPFTPFSVSRHVPTEQCDQVAHELTHLYESGMQIPHLVYLLRALADERSATQNAGGAVALVWSGPETPGAASRDTSVVVRELFSGAESSVLVAGFAISHGSEIFRALAERMARVPNLSVRMFLNVARGDDDRDSNEGIVRSFYLSFKTKHWPWEKYPKVFL